jgi:hypothetical protein
VSEITPEQKAVKIAGRLELQPDDPNNGNDGWYWIDGRIWRIEKWLLTAKGQEAMMDKWGEKYMIISFIAQYDSEMFNFKTGDNIVQVCEMTHGDFMDTKQISYGIAPTRHEALINAILEMLKDET